MSQITKPHGDFAADTIAESAKVNDQINTIYNDHNGQLTDFNINSLANINQSKILNLVGDFNTIRSTRVNSVSHTVFIANDTYFKPSNLLFARVIAIGGGGGGGNAQSTTGSSVSSGGGGGSGAYSESWLMAVAIASVETVTIGQGGAPQGDGTLTSFGASVAANGGAAGQGNTDSIGAGGVGGVAGGAQIAITGATGYVGFITTAPSTIACGGMGGAKGPYMMAGAPTPTVASAAGGTGFLGGGGAGAGSGGVNSAFGGPGGGGIVIITEFKA